MFAVRIPPLWTLLLTEVRDRRLKDSLSEKIMRELIQGAILKCPVNAALLQMSCSCCTISQSKRAGKVRKHGETEKVKESRK